jgi:hypothetical protein
VNCHAENPHSFLALTMGLVALSHIPSSPGAQGIFKKSGVEPAGLLIEETFTKKVDGNEFVNKTELLEISDEPLEQSLFEVPANYKRGEVQRHPGQIPEPVQSGP